MPKLKLTKTNIDRVRKPGTGTIIYTDTETKGFGLRLTNSGAASFIVQRMIAGSSKERRITIGEYGAWTVEDARKVAEKHIALMRDGIDPVAAKAEAKKADEAMAVTLRDVADSYMNRPGKLKPRSKDAIERIVTTVFEKWEHKPIVQITEDMCRTRYKEMAEKGLHGDREGGSPGQANQAFDILRAMLNYAARQYRRSDGKPLIQHNPVEILADHKVKLKPRTSRYIPKEKVGDVWHTLTTHRATVALEKERTSTDLVMFLLLTGARLEETASLQWANVHIVDDAAECRWRISNRKRGDDVWMPLSSQAVELLNRRPKVENNPYVFASFSARGYMDQPRGALDKVVGAAGSHLSAHDMRRTMTNIALGVCRIEKFRTDLLTGHKPKNEDVTASHYLDTENLTWLHPEIQQIGDWIEQQGRLAAAKASGANVVALPQRA
ncbi:integrase family protein [Sandaracinobacter sp. RS1-74]|uniref:tyrosine-type recombinase/integrase n=1 Tax=Sandaracinobacteroides sayramensis TaxID=2913411 RepID=UPI001EDACE96|nr:integrase family protein [Sandaracinobacteroides sayramensis]MCG2840185.1 integrase family protein [Sandaracinobacteroides sayramensis]